MVTNKGFNKAMVLLFACFPNRLPKGTEGEIKTVLDLWKKWFEKISDEDLLAAVDIFCRKTKSLFPDDNLVGMISDFANPNKQHETVADFKELLTYVKFHFGSRKIDEGAAWMETKSPLCSAVMRKFGWEDYYSGNEVFVMNQLQNFFKQEKDRTNEIGRVIKTAHEFKDGRLPQQDEPKQIEKWE